MFLSTVRIARLSFNLFGSNLGLLRILTTLYSWCWIASGGLNPDASYSPTRIFSTLKNKSLQFPQFEFLKKKKNIRIIKFNTYSFGLILLSLCAAVKTFLVPRPLSLLPSLGIIAHVPTKSLALFSIRQVQGNSPGLASPNF